MLDSENQIILVDKPAGISSFGVVAKVRGFLKAEFGHKIKVGHTGTLDPFATGLLIILTGKNTKKSNDFLKLDKVYEATLRLGFTSTTGDPEGIINEYAGTKVRSGEEHLRLTRRNSRANPVTTGVSEGGSEPDLTFVQHTLSNFVGVINQKVPAFSAVKIDGERAYRLARAGKTFDTPTREVTIYSIEVLNYHYPELKIRTHVSSGTYIRTLAEDIGAALGTGAYLTALRRVQIADYSVASALPLSAFEKKS